MVAIATEGVGEFGVLVPGSLGVGQAVDCREVGSAWKKFQGVGRGCLGSAQGG